MKNVGRIAIALCIFAFGVRAHAEPALSGEQLEQTVFLSMALDATPEKSRRGVWSIVQQSSINEALSDTLAELLVQSQGLETDKKWIDTIAWYAAALRDSHNPRYTNILQQARERYSDVKILKAIDAAITNTAVDANLSVPGGKQVKQYVAGGVDIKRKRAEVQQVLLAHQKSDRRGFVNIQPEFSFEQVLDSLGVPDDITLMTLPIAKWGRTSRLVAHYAGAGMLVFRFDRALKPQWVVSEPVDEPFDVKAVYVGSQFGLAQTLSSLRGQSFRLYLKVNRRAFQNDASLLSILGERLIALPYPADKFEANGMGLAMRFVAQSKDPSSMDLLRRIAATSDKRVARSAQNYLKRRELAAGSAVNDDEKDEAEMEEGESPDGEDPTP